jgi:general secretion pathway protein I
MQTLNRSAAALGSGQRRKQRGFTLIEAIVALVLIATTGMALFSWLNSNLITLNRVQDSNTENAATLNALEYMHTINPMLTPEGQADLGAYQLSWKAEPTTEPRDGAGYPYGIGLYQLRLFDTQVALNTASGQAWLTFSLKQVGHKKVRSLFNDQ